MAPYREWMTPKRLDQVIRELREKKGLTQEELAFKARVTPGYVAQLKVPLAELLA